MQNPNSEDQLVEQPAIALLAEMGWETLDCFDEFNQGSSPLGRENSGEVVLTTRLRAALERLNPDASSEAIDAAIEKLTESRATMSLIEANWKIYSLLPLKDRLHSDEKILGGKPVIKGTRLAVAFILELLGHGWSEEEVLDNYPDIGREDIAVCLAYQQKIKGSD